MDPERWKHVDNLLQAALDHPPEEREAFLKNACAGDEQLAREVRSLLASRQKAGSFLESPAMEVAARAEALRDAARQTDPLIGQTVSHYRISAKLGMGGMGVVYKATDEKLHRIVALKCLRAEESAGSERNRFLQEARAASALDHPNIGVIHGIEELDDGRLFIVMAYYEGETLAEKLKRAPLDPATGVEIVRQTAQALAEAHAKNIVHRDVKPANIMLTRQGSVKLLDFGLAKQLSGDETLTQTGTTMGTAAYMSPEQAQGQRVDHRTDIWSLGVVLYEILSGRQPFRRDSVPSTLLAVTQDSPPPLVGVRAELQAAVFKCLSKDVDRRYHSAADVVRDLEPDRIAPGSGDPTITLPIEIRAASARPATAQEGIAKRWKTLVPIAAVVSALLAGSFFYFGRPLFGNPKLTDKDTLVLADFVNKTDDAVFDETLGQGLAFQLEQSPFLSILSDQRVQTTLGLMGQQTDTRLTPQIAKEICERTASAAVLEGSIAPLGSQYVLGLRAKNCHTGDVLDEEQVQAARKEDVLNALSQIATKFRTRVGESLATVKKLDTPLEEATTPSLEALQAYSAAWKVHISRGDDAALPLFKRATELDPKFAIAYAFLGRSYGDLGESALSAESTTRAYQLRDHTSDREKFFIAATYDQQVTGNLEKARETFELWAQTYPREIRPHGLLSGQIYPVLGKYEKAVEEAKKAIEIDPNFAFPYANLATAYQFLDRFGEADAIYRQASDRKLEFPDLLLQRYDFAFVKGDQVGMEREAAASRRNPGAEAAISRHEAFALAYSGHLQQARRKSQLAVDLAQKAGEPERAALWEAGAAAMEALFGNAPEARREAKAVLEISKGRDVEYGAAFALALAGDASEAQTLANDLGKRFPEDTSVQVSYLPELRALLAVNPPLNQKSDPERAIELLQVSGPYELGVPLSWFSGTFGVLYPIYVRGNAYLAEHKGAEAAAEFQKILDHRAIVATDPIGALAHLQLGRAFAMSGDKLKAKAAYQDFLVLWKDADSDIPVLMQAKAEYANLQ